jgi:hypothetical protein
MGAFELKYSVQRQELWNYYWWAWRQPDGLWIYWLIFSLAALALGWLWASISETTNLFEATALICLTGACFFVLFPQLAYKPQERSVTIDADGIDTTIGARSGHRGWADISSVTSRGDSIILMVSGGTRLLPGLWLLTRVGNAFIIPNRAFKGAEQRQEFLGSAQNWHRPHAQKFPALSTKRYLA